MSNELTQLAKKFMDADAAYEDAKRLEADSRTARCKAEEYREAAKKALCDSVPGRVTIRIGDKVVAAEKTYQFVANIENFLDGGK